jgi:hypothetical protein
MRNQQIEQQKTNTSSAESGGKNGIAYPSPIQLRNQISSPNTYPASVRAQPIQRMTLLPFAKADNDLNKFVNENAAGMAGEIVIGNPGKKIGKSEKLVVVGHGNGTDLYSHSDEKSSDLKKMTAAELAEYLIANVLPNGYNGEIVVWSCNSATPWKNIPVLKNQIEKKVKKDDQEQYFDMTFIKQLEAFITHDETKNFAPTISGAIGFVSLDKKWDNAKVYADEKNKLIGPTKDADDGGFIKTDETPPKRNWYDGFEEEEEDVEVEEEVESLSSEENQSKSSSEEDRMDVVQPVMIPLRQAYPDFDNAIKKDTAGARIMSKMGHILVPSNMKPNEMSHYALSLYYKSKH